MVIAPVEVVIVQAHDGPLRGRVASQPLRDALSAQVIQLILDPAVPAEALVGVHVHAGEHRAIHGDREAAILIALPIPSADILAGQAVKVVRESHGLSPFCSIIGRAVSLIPPMASPSMGGEWLTVSAPGVVLSGG